MKNFLLLLPGSVLALLVAILSYPIQNLPIKPFTLSTGIHPIEAMSIALLLGIVLANLIKLPLLFDKGLQLCTHKILPLGIILLGFRLNLHILADFSIMVLITIIVVSLTAFVSALLLGRLFKIPTDISLLIGIGNAICGSSAIAAAAPLTRASKGQIAVVIAIVNLLGLIAVFLLPFVAHLFSMSSQQLGIWAGATVQAVPQAIACGFTFNTAAGNIATVVKLIRVLLLGPYIVIIRLFTSIADKRSEGKSPITIKALLNFFPIFILLFFMVVLINSYLPLKILALPNTTFDVRQLLIHFSSLLLAMALAAIGLQTDLRLLIQQSKHYLLLGLLSTLLATAVTLPFITLH